MIRLIVCLSFFLLSLGMLGVQGQNTVVVLKSSLRYLVNEKHHLQTFAALDSFFANIQDNRMLPDCGNLADNISRIIVPGGLRFTNNFTKHLVYYLYAGHTLMNDIRLYDKNKDDV